MIKGGTSIRNATKAVTTTVLARRDCWKVTIPVHPEMAAAFRQVFAFGKVFKGQLVFSDRFKLTKPVRRGRQEMHKSYHEAQGRQYFTSTHQGLADVWREVQAGHLDKLAGRSNFLGRAIIDHPQYHPFLEVPLVFGTEADEAKVREAILHLTTDSEVLQQISTDDPTETGEAYRALLAVGVEDHEARHTISRVMAEVIWQINQGRKLDPNYLLSKLRGLASSPMKVLREQERQSLKRR